MTRAEELEQNEVKVDAMSTGHWNDILHSIPLGEKIPSDYEKVHFQNSGGGLAVAVYEDHDTVNLCVMLPLSEETYTITLRYGTEPIVRLIKP